MSTRNGEDVPSVDSDTQGLRSDQNQEATVRLTAKDEIGGVKFDHLGKEYVWVTPESLSSK